MSESPVELPEHLRRRYRVDRLLGSGGFGTVVAATDLELDRPVAIKLLRQQQPDSTASRRFEREARALAGLSHPNVLAVFDSGRSETGPFLISELLEGEPLSCLGPGATLRSAMLAVAEGLEAVHRAGLLHRDVKPENIVLTRDGRVVLIDFGLVHDPASTRLTSTGVMVGTLPYMAPELLAGREATPGSDWYAWAATWFDREMGRPPVGVREIMRFAGEGGFPPVDWSGFEPGGELADLLASCLEPDPARRVGSLAEVRRVLGRPPSARRSPPAGSAPVAATLLTDAPMAAPGGASTPSGRTARRAGSVAVGLGILLAVGLATRYLPGAGPARPGGGAGTIPAGAEPLDTARDGRTGSIDLAYLERVRSELAEAAGRWVGPGGELVPDGRPPPDGSWQLLDPDPARAPARRRHLPELGRFSRWMAEGGRPEDLPPPVRSALLEIDERFASQELPRPFAAFLVLPLAEPEPVPERVRSLFAGLKVEGVATPPAAGWLGKAWQELDRALEEVARLHDQAIDDPKLVGYLSGLEANFLVAHVWGRTEVRALVAVGVANPQARLRCMRWLSEMRVPGLAAAYAMARSIRQEPATRELVGAAIVVASQVFELASFGAVDEAILQALLPGLSTGPAESHFRCMLGDYTRSILHERSDREAFATGNLADALAASAGPWDTPLRRYLGSASLLLAARRMVELSRLDDLRRLVLRVRSRERDVDPKRGAEIRYEAAQALVLRNAPEPFLPDEIEWLRTCLATEGGWLVGSRARRLPDLLVSLEDLAAR